MISNNTLTITKQDGTTFECTILKKNFARGKYSIDLVSCLGKEYAMKVFPSSIPDSYRHFTTEASFSILDHPNVIVASLTGSYIENDQTFYVILTEYCKNGTFFDIMRTHGHLLSEKMLRTYFKQLLEAVEYIHSEGVSHLDIKLENIFLDGNYKLRLADFDLAHTETRRTYAGGTINYKAPEQSLYGFNTQKADIFTLGVNLFVMRFGANFYPYSNFFGNRRILERNPNEFWDFFLNKLDWDTEIINNDFKTLFTQMTFQNPNMRFTLSQIRESVWMKGEVFDQSEIEVIMTDILNE
jgi:serine/threonine protein kinase